MTREKNSMPTIARNIRKCSARNAANWYLSSNSIITWGPSTHRATQLYAIFAANPSPTCFCIDLITVPCTKPKWSSECSATFASNRKSESASFRYRIRRLSHFFSLISTGTRIKQYLPDISENICTDRKFVPFVATVNHDHFHSLIQLLIHNFHT